MKQTKDSKAGAVKKMNSYESPGPVDMKGMTGALRDGHHKLSGSLMGDLRNEGSAMEEAGESEVDEASEMDNTFGVNKKQMKSNQDYTRIKSGVKSSKNKIGKLAKNYK